MQLKRPKIWRFAAAYLSVVVFSFAAQAEPPVERPVLSVTLLLPDTGRVAINAQGDKIAYERLDYDGFYHIFVAQPDGVGARCLTCTAAGLKKTNTLSPVWHPSGEFLLFQSQTSAKKMGLTPVDLLGGYRGLRSELWYVLENGKSFYQLTQTNQHGGTVLAPIVSWEGDRIAWAERVESRVGRWGSWVLRVAEIRVKKGYPRMGKVETYEPGAQKLFLVPSTFTPDDKAILFAGNREPGQRENGMDLYEVRLESQIAGRLTHTRNAWDMGGRYTTRGDRIVWASGNDIDLSERTLEDPVPPESLRDLWIMKADGDGKTRLTFFNDPTAAESLGPTIVDDFVFHPSEPYILAHLITADDQGRVREGIYRIDLDPTFRRSYVP